ncbi:cytochrome ubiquinol oxidase subunit I [Micromonospora sp. WMMD882]|uniref:cytochrome ubiquinol oxidase subunit I n=1 Tax=Micromonospora sp. WMMD882 TaxID=3015151 RepID=UPI00248B0AB6|nr:cytochrome ubiquinol oxidase subunit I [Micromonospora sp. WMMD882]WBB77525.1 cytochrome ubiquinol oxidase subunit I [Micromonospora sp. WMMD882]
MDPLLLARLQFATTTSIHFLFVLVTLGLITLLVYLQTRWVATRKPVYERLTRFWGTIYVINYVLGIAAGVVLEFQFGLNWSGLSKYVGNVFGAPLAIETLTAFFLESTFLGMWIFGWHRLRRGVHLALLWGVALTAYVSAFWIMVGNAWLQNPVGYETRDGIAHLTDFPALVTNPAFGTAFLHTVLAALLTGGILMASVSAWHLIRRAADVEAYRISLRTGLVTAALAVGPLLVVGFVQVVEMARLQPTKYGVPAEKAAKVAELTAIFGPGDYEAPTAALHSLSFMFIIGFLLVLILLQVVLLPKDLLIRLRFPLWIILFALPLPFVASILGWLAREIGRQPFAVYGLLTVDDAVSPVGGGVMLASFLGFTLLLGALAVTNWVLIARHATRGAHDDLALGRPPEQPEPATDDRPEPVFV